MKRIAKAFFLCYNTAARKAVGAQEGNMNDKLILLEEKRIILIKKFKKLGRFRRGTIVVRYRKCGKQHCVCKKPGHIGHGPYYEWNTTIKGKSFAKNLTIGSELQKYKEETDNYIKYQELQKEFLQVNEEICNLTPHKLLKPDQEEALKKKLRKLYKAKLKKK
jgi:hypothetical protein